MAQQTVRDVRYDWGSPPVGKLRGPSDHAATIIDLEDIFDSQFSSVPHIPHVLRPASRILDSLGFERGYLFLADKILPSLVNVADRPR
ncbi:MAG: hypothetical protein ACYC3X_26120 [Pirellulaceae bacterium]